MVTAVRIEIQSLFSWPDTLNYWLFCFFVMHMQTDIFEIRALDLGPICKVIMEHNKQGRGRGWFCEKAVVKIKEAGRCGNHLPLPQVRALPLAGFLSSSQMYHRGTVNSLGPPRN